MGIEIVPDGKGFLLVASMRVPRPIAEVFDFFSNARNLERLTPPSLRFHVLTEGPIEMAEGTRIDYQLKVHKIPIRWQSEITAWEPPYRFVDEQSRGPYRWWVHEHLFEEQGEFTFVRDRVRYAAPGGRLMNRLFVARDLRKIFAFRAKALADVFGTAERD